jgi:hypothetical protein
VTIPAGRSTEATFTLSKATAVPEGPAGVDRILYRLLTGHYREEMFECALNPRCCRCVGNSWYSPPEEEEFANLEQEEFANLEQD